MAHRLPVAAWGISLLGAALSVVAGALMGGRAYVATSVLVIAFAMLPFFASFERQRPQARQLAVLAVLCALGVAARALFKIGRASCRDRVCWSV